MKNGEAMARLLELMARLRDPAHGCPWDLKQTFASIAPYTIEEAYEVADAIDHGDAAHLRDELGDLLFQVVFHARMAEERGWFDFADVAEAIRDKLTRRHPHIFAGAQLAAEDLVRVWEEQKAQERAASAPPGPGTVLSGVPRALPALGRAAKLGKRAARVGFDWPQAREVRAKVIEELHEVDEAVGPADAEAADEQTHARVAEEIGDLLFSVANWSRHLGVDPEEALRRANAKFERRFVRMEGLAQQQRLELKELSAAQWDALWRAAKLNGS
ncbi:MAG: nucleoside triphosphate pyrophosphohydrolase [Proteobacteria bacterium]|nr:nucleoside triphosphate pyrophosphohydrolase [Pseudomonadota bacterium]